jgi:hypothetical protein
MPRMLSIEELKIQADIALIIERVTWAAWMKRTASPAGPVPSGPFETVDVEASLSIGSWVAERLNTIGVSQLAGVTLSTTPLIGRHSPPNWSELLLNWANMYREDFVNAEPLPPAP